MTDVIKEREKKEARDANRDPITKKPGAHPVGTGVGAAAGGAAGIAAGAAASAATGVATGTVLGGPAGAAVGLVAGAVVGGLAGKAAGEAVNPTKEEQFWRESYKSQPYYDKAYSYDDYGPAYRTGYEGFNRYSGKSYDEIESSLEQDYARNRGQSKLDWDRARPATRAAWDRLGSGERTGKDAETF
jgi:hypothetical protein